VADIRLEPFARDHLEALNDMLEDPDVLRFTRVPEPVPAGFAESWVERYERGRADGTRMNFAVVEGPERRFAGFAVAPVIDTEAATAELGYVVAGWARGRGVGTAALRELTAWAFSELGMVRLELLIDVDNPASKRVAEHCGYMREGVLRSAYVKPGRRTDTEIWSRLVTDPLSQST
jgi:RimJ/RimL family protein N-acetyltransferase